MKTINIMTETAEWITTAEAAKILGRNERTVQEMAKDRRLISKPAGRADQPKARLYDAEDVKRFAQGNPRVSGFVPREPKAIVLRNRKPGPGERDMALVVGSLVANHKAELEMIAAQFAESLKAVTTLILDAHKAEREDARQRWELERQDRLERERRRRQAAQAKREQPKAKAKRAHA